MSFQRITIEEGKHLVDEQDVTIVDVRDTNSYELSHLKNALMVDQGNIDDFLNSTDKSKPLIVYCYHGNMSQVAADYFTNEGFSKVYSLDGGFEEWKNKFDFFQPAK